MPSTILQHDVRAVANYYINKARKRQNDDTSLVLDPLMLQTIVYTAHVAHALCYDVPLCTEHYQDTETAPYFPTLREALKFSKNDEIPNFLHSGAPVDSITKDSNVVFVPISSVFTPNQKSLLDQIWQFFVDNKIHFAIFEQSATQIEKRKEGATPRSIAVKPNEMRIAEQNEMLKKHFSGESMVRYGTN